MYIGIETKSPFKLIEVMRLCTRVCVCKCLFSIFTLSETTMCLAAKAIVPLKLVVSRNWKKIALGTRATIILHTVHPYFNAIPCSVSVCWRLWRIRYSLFRTWLQVLPYFFNWRAESRMDCRSLNKLSLSIAINATYAPHYVTSHHLNMNYLCITQPRPISAKYFRTAITIAKAP